MNSSGLKVPHPKKMGMETARPRRPTARMMKERGHKDVVRCLAHDHGPVFRLKWDKSFLGPSQRPRTPDNLSAHNELAPEVWKSGRGTLWFSPSRNTPNSTQKNRGRVMYSTPEYLRMEWGYHPQAGGATDAAGRPGVCRLVAPCTTTRAQKRYLWDLAVCHGLN